MYDVRDLSLRVATSSFGVSESVVPLRCYPSSTQCCYRSLGLNGLGLNMVPPPTPERDLRFVSLSRASERACSESLHPTQGWTKDRDRTNFVIKMVVRILGPAQGRGCRTLRFTTGPTSTVVACVEAARRFPGKAEAQQQSKKFSGERESLLAFSEQYIPLLPSAEY